MKASNPDNPSEKYEISYSQKLQERIAKAIESSNKLKITLMILAFAVIVMLAALLFSDWLTIVGRRTFCL